ncbi:MAG TPA: NAD(P)/FAD-dependent oxidoreductase [Mycobacteriales bacterium]|nr:NAD(P)/FAD-dependent oxidoreductase [Mycobacteriales bacterium]
MTGTGGSGLVEEADVVVIGSGHNALVCAGYLAEAGFEVLVLEARDVVGGNTATEELTLPGFAHDSCSSAHVLIQSNPLLADDELGLRARYGLDYVYPDPAVVMPLDGGDALVMRPDAEATEAELARWSPADAVAYRRMLAEWDGGLARAHARWNSGVPAEDDAGRRYAALRRCRAADVIHQRFEHPVVRSFMLWLAFATITDPHRPGTGALVPAIVSGRTRYGWTTPLGGSAALPAALLAHLAAHGGTAFTSAAVSRIHLRGDRACAVETRDGRRFRARRAVVSSAHLTSLPAMLGDRDTPEELTRASAAWRPGLSLFAVHAALRADPRFHTRNGPTPAVAGALGSAAGLRHQLAEFAAGRPDPVDPWLLVVAPTVVDPGRAPDGGCTLKLLTVAPYRRADGRSWEDTKDDYARSLLDLVRARADGLDDTSVLATLAESPVDLARRNPHNVGGSCHGGEFVWNGEVLPGWPSHRSPVPGLYLTGATTHPGGSVSGRAGRNTARTLLGDLGVDPHTVMGDI